MESRVRGHRQIAQRLGGGSYQSANEPIAFFGLGAVSTIERLEIVWPDGDVAVEEFPAPSVDRSYTLRRGEGRRKLK